MHQTTDFGKSEPLYFHRVGIVFAFDLIIYLLLLFIHKTAMLASFPIDQVNCTIIFLIFVVDFFTLCIIDQAKLLSVLSINYLSYQHLIIFDCSARLSFSQPDILIPFFIYVLIISLFLHVSGNIISTVDCLVNYVSRLLINMRNSRICQVEKTFRVVHLVNVFCMVMTHCSPAKHQLTSVMDHFLHLSLAHGLFVLKIFMHHLIIVFSLSVILI